MPAVALLCKRHCGTRLSALTFGTAAIPWPSAILAARSRLRLARWNECTQNGILRTPRHWQANAELVVFCAKSRILVSKLTWEFCVPSDAGEAYTPGLRIDKSIEIPS
jgi:hypothetical protein